MRAPPAVSVNAGPDRAWRVFQALLGGGAGAAVGAWLGLTFADLWFGIVAAVGSALVCAALAWRLSAQPRLYLAWTGVEWRLKGANEEGEGQAVPAPAVMIDLGSWLLMRVRPAGASAIWLTLGRGAAGASWHPFRAAVYSSEIEPSPLPSEHRTPF